MSAKTALIMAGGTGGHIFPGLAVAEELRARGWRVHWLGAPASMEARIVPAHGFALETIDFSGVRGKGLATLALLPLRLLRAFWQAWRVVRRVQPDVVVGLGGYISFPGGMMAVLAGKPLVLHEQNSVAGMANKVLARVADRVFTAFPHALAQGQWVGNPLRKPFTEQADPAVRFAGRSGPLRPAKRSAGPACCGNAARSGLPTHSALRSTLGKAVNNLSATTANTRLAIPATEFCSCSTNGLPARTAIMPPGKLM